MPMSSPGPAVENQSAVPELPTSTRIKVTESQHFVFFLDENNLGLATQMDEIADELEQVYVYVTQRVSASIEGKTEVTFRQPSTDPCPARGMAEWSPSQTRITIYADEGTSREQILGAAAHEVGHLIQFQHFDSGPADPILLEGWATWAAGSYWAAWQGIASFDEGVRSYLQDGRFIPIADPDLQKLIYGSEGCLEHRDVVYTEWASFLDYLIDQYGFDALLSLIAANFPTMPTIEAAVEATGVSYHEANYQAVYGRTLQELEADWLEHLRVGLR